VCQEGWRKSEWILHWFVWEHICIFFSLFDEANEQLQSETTNKLISIYWFHLWLMFLNVCKRSFLKHEDIFSLFIFILFFVAGCWLCTIFCYLCYWFCTVPQQKMLRTVEWVRLYSINWIFFFHILFYLISIPKNHHKPY